MTLERIHVKQGRDELQARMSGCSWRSGFAIADTEEHGRLMLVHSDDKGEFELSMRVIKALFASEGCDSLMCCYPAKQYEVHPMLAHKLNILYPELDEELFTNIGEPGIIATGCGDYDEWCAEHNRNGV